MKLHTLKVLLVLSIFPATQVFGAPAPLKPPVKPKASSPAKPPAKPAAPLSVEGVYVGTITMSRSSTKEPLIQLPIVFSLQFTDNDIATNPDEPFAVKKVIAGSFLIDDEAGPFPLTLSDFEVNRAHFNLQYNKMSALGSPSSAVSLRFECDRHTDGSCSGTVVSAQNSKFGTFTMHKSSRNASVLTPKPKYVGEWRGKVTIIDRDNDPNTPLKEINYWNKVLSLPELPAVNDIEFHLAASDGQDPTNPPKLELDSTPKRIGTVMIANDPYNRFTFSTIVFDYFHRKSYLTIASAAYPTTTTLQSTFIATYDKNGNFTDGQWNTANYGETGNFTAEKLP